MEQLNSQASPRKRLPLHTKILLGLVLGGLIGLLAQFILPGGSSHPALRFFVDVVATPVGGIFLTMIFMIVVPLLFSALALGVAEIGDAVRVGRVGIKSLALTVVLSGIAVVLALVAVNLVQPGAGISEEKRAQLIGAVDRSEAEHRAKAESLAQVDPPVLGLVPKNPLLEASRAFSGGLLPFMFFALVFGLAMAGVPSEKSQPVKAFLEGLFAISLRVIEMAMKLAPIGVFALTFKTGAILGLDAFIALGKYALLVLFVLALHQYGVYSLVLRFVAKRSPLQFFRAIRTVQLTAFATSSSNATLPTALRASEEELGLPRDIGSFVLTVGATANQNGTALFEGITILFLAQFMGVELALSQQLQVLFLAILAGIGTAGVPGGAWPMIASILSRFGIGAESIGLVLGIDRLLDMSRTVLNVTGDMVIATCVTRWEGREAEPPQSVLG